METLNSDRQHPWREALRASNLQRNLIDIMSASHAMLEIAVCDNEQRDPDGQRSQSQRATDSALSEFRADGDDTNWLHKVKHAATSRVTTNSSSRWAHAGQAGQLYVRVVIYPPLIKALDIMPTLKKSAGVALASVARRALHHASVFDHRLPPAGPPGAHAGPGGRGEYDPKALVPVSRTGADEFGIMATKVNLLGQRLRGAQFDFSDLRGNFERLLRSTGRRGADVRPRPPPGGGFRRGGEIPGRDARRPGGPRPAGDLPAQHHAGADAGAGRANRPAHPQPPRAHRRRRRLGRIRGIALGGYSGAARRGQQPGRGTGLLVRLRDPEAARQVGRQLQTADRLSAISRITSGVAHEVKNPLNAILMHVEVARMKLARGDTDVAPQMEIISREILRLDRVVKTFLDFTRPVELHLADVPLESFVREIVDLAAPQAEAAGIQVSVDADTEAASIRVDAT